MTPKEKAVELVYRFMQPIDGLHKYPMCFDTAKQCALIAVDEILNENSIREGDNDEIITYEPYWLKVKQEIQML